MIKVLRCEYIAKLLPSIRAMIAKELVMNGLTQEDAARILGVSQGAISQYVRRLRGKKIVDSDISKAVKDLCKRIVNEGIDVNEGICNMCKQLRDSKAF
ncbi:MAG: helix-turn-helix domain-containing protein [Candidatus Aenigmarchaeota archaeon]|nr:helix-turn-helix domain-containing protein [Candidatus Aenigmarchaeota archaeon]